MMERYGKILIFWQQEIGQFAEAATRWNSRGAQDLTSYSLEMYSINVDQPEPH
jgi:hypothetical protein